MDELHQAQPSVVLSVLDPTGADVLVVRTFVDNVLVAERQTGLPLEVDPGQHTFTFVVPDQPPVTVTAVVREGEKSRGVRVVLAPHGLGTAADARGGSSEGAISSPSADPSGTRRVIALSLGGTGVAGLILGGAFGIVATNAWTRTKDLCGQDVAHCSDVQDAAPYEQRARNAATVSTTAFIAGGVLAGSGVVLWLIPERARERTADRLSVAPLADASGLELRLGGTF